MAIKSTTLDNTPTTIFQSNTIPSVNSVVTSLYFCNTSASALTFNMYLVRSGDVASPSNIVYYNVEISATDTYVLDTEKIMLSANDTIQASGSFSSQIVATVSYMEY